MQSTVTLRFGRPDDVDALLELMMISSWGGIRAAWERVTSPGETWRERGLLELSDGRCEIGYTRFVIAEIDGRIGGMILLNMIGNTDSMNPALEPPEQAGAIALIKEARQSIFVRELATAEWARGKGLAKQFLDVATRAAVANGLSRSTLIVNDANGPAHMLYRKCGFRQIDCAPSVGHPAFDDSSMLLLMERPVPESAT